VSHASAILALAFGASIMPMTGRSRVSLPVRDGLVPFHRPWPKAQPKRRRRSGSARRRAHAKAIAWKGAR